MLSLFMLLAQGVPVPPTPRDEACRGLGFAISYAPRVARQGETVTLVPMRVAGHGMPPEEMPSKCLDDWKVEGAGVKLVREKGSARRQLRIAADAVPGAEIHFWAQGENGEAHGRLIVIARDAQVLSGTFGKREQSGCLGAEVSEMAFTADGYYTWTRPDDMFETKVSGSGYYRWDAASGRFELLHGREGKVLQRGTAKWIDGRLVLDSIEPGGPMGSDDGTNVSKCHIVFSGG
ncbi:hypothetical protein P6144_18900 [Sphingomonas sp. HITSZ_GF]|uniref:hypothetical protein n=1 Tax=Sphingomonas sp. HITSZ_GF TaxID=3037247 RepID=UPI00240D0339|nr:hypothetical protein [Sphingomonas sp. HITSZ_GF]MDG2535737.1 hypothetical protein [Sphingomonas sp. HITSZ_GF]